MLDGIIKKLAIILVLCGGIVSLLYFTDLGAILKGEAKKKVEKKVEEFKKDVKEKLDDKKEKVEKEVKKVEDKVESNIEEVKDKVESNVEEAKEKIEDLKKLKLKDIIK
tara:strand:+ start:424 stop:750 length:327 start_codon:yes stop_codon:yes gene_type:complete